MNNPFQIHEQPGHFVASRPVTAAEILSMAKSLIAQKFTRGQALTVITFSGSGRTRHLGFDQHDYIHSSSLQGCQYLARNWGEFLWADQSLVSWESSSTPQGLPP